MAWKKGVGYTAGAAGTLLGPGSAMPSGESGLASEAAVLAFLHSAVKQEPCRGNQLKPVALTLPLLRHQSPSQMLLNRRVGAWTVTTWQGLHSPHAGMSTSENSLRRSSVCVTAETRLDQSQAMPALAQLSLEHNPTSPKPPDAMFPSHYISTLQKTAQETLSLPLLMLIINLYEQPSGRQCQT